VSNTPETDARDWSCANRDTDQTKKAMRSNLLFARTLETQRDEARAEVERLRKALEVIRDISISMVDGQRTGCASVILNEGPRRIKEKANQVLMENFALPTSPEIFEAHGLEWYRHTPRDKMPCDGEMIVEVLWSSDDDESSRIDALAWTFNWDIKELRNEEIIGWRPADAPEKLPR